MTEHEDRLTRLEEAFVTLAELAKHQESRVSTLTQITFTQNKALQQIGAQLERIETGVKETTELMRRVIDPVNQQGDRIDRRLESMDGRIEKIEQALTARPTAIC